MPQATGGNQITSSAQIVDDIITSLDIKDSEIVNADIAAGAGIAKSKLGALAIVNADVDAAAAIVDTKLAQIATASKVSGAAITLLNSVPAGAGILPVANSQPVATAVTLFPRPVAPTKTAAITGIDNNAHGNNTEMMLSQIIIPAKITANKISVNATVVTVAGTLKITLYAEDGQSQIFAITTANIAVASIVSTALSAVVINPGIYYMTILAVGTANISLGHYQTETDAKALDLYDIAGEPDMVGVLTVTADTPPATFTPTAITSSPSKGSLYFRLDN